ncbi:hypothetical protein PY254_00030 [Rhodanobacter sp. AS-Z3]|uniref:hypothetical protein n=1 Tax=Rhodanobacter sp. AS-Z3 TaxID=3031330 RepID=UPI00247AEA1B|nr:hypothetical protein [Rhodanobacter sp. AS-Z3]WEN15109.1 hypothetical protein PY254_00030 [Rhodanobacter sp. AS-Z3]
MKATVAIIVYIASVIASLLIGANIGERKATTHASIEVNGIQADLLFNRILDERKMQSMLSRGCVSEATLELDINEDQDMRNRGQSVFKSAEKGSGSLNRMR